MNEILTKEQQKKIAVKRLKQLGVEKAYVDAFAKNGTVTMFELYAGYWATAWNGEAELESAIKSYEEESGNLVYAVTHELTAFGELYDFLIVSKYAGDEMKELEEEDGLFYPFCYVKNQTYDYMSELGTIAVQAALGGIRRVG